VARLLQRDFQPFAHGIDGRELAEAQDLVE